MTDESSENSGGLSMRWLGLVALLIAEVVLVTIRVDTASLQHVSGWWAEIARSRR